ncbi:MAG: tetratricopeptide repeat protein [Calditrichaeota bacterium]|nr:tetratricopeptide repeat protein [Calditrichota bacterium]MCB9366416.1 tetratricopeptide repeat protein [Calditrichota bacterium]
MKSRYLHRTLLVLSAFLFLISGCAYYNTFYNIKKDFQDAERQTKRSAQAQSAIAAPAPGQPNRPGQAGQGGVPLQQYQQVIKSCGNLIQFYPKSRWVDDALYVMGVSYFRIQEYSRAERKFNELIAIFPKSKHVEMATIWRAKSLLAQNKYDEAERVLKKDESIFVSADARAGAYRTLAAISDEQGRPEDAVEYLEQIEKVSYSRDDKATDQLRLGRSYLALDRTEEAKTVLRQCLALTRSPEEIFRVRSILASIAANANDYPLAIGYLLPLRTDRRFIDRGGDIEIELARVEAKCGNPALALQMLEGFTNVSATGEKKASAYYLQGEVARDKLSEFDLAKAKFDSAAASGASETLRDSARQASRQLESGLSALARIPVLEDSLSLLLSQSSAAESEESEIDSSSKDSLKNMRIDSLVQTAPDFEEMSLDEDVVDSLQIPEQIAQTDSLPPPRRTPAEMIADSIMRSLQMQDSIRFAEASERDSIALDSLSVLLEMSEDSLSADSLISDSMLQKTPSAEIPQGPTEEELRALKIADFSRRLVVAHLDAAAFYEFVVKSEDSLLAHLTMAIEVDDSSADHWRALLQYSLLLEKSEDESERSQARVQLSDISENDAVPHEMRNIARARLGLPALPRIETEQDIALRRAESMLLDGSDVSAVIEAYDDVLGMDSTSDAGVRALHAIAYLQEFELEDFGAAIETHSTIVALFPDSIFAEFSRAKIAEPDSHSIFLLSEEALSTSFQPATELLNAEADSTGWPPDVQSLRGRRFR